MLKKIINTTFKLNNKELDFRERLYRMMLLLGGTMLCMAILQSFFIINRTVLFFVLIIMFAIMSVAIRGLYKKNRLAISALLVGIMANMILFPIMFFLSGGIYSGATVWFVLGIVYWVIMFSGKKLFILEVITILFDLGAYGIGYHYPHLIVPMVSNTAVYTDSVSAVFSVAVVITIIFQYQISLYKEERATVIKQKEELEKIGNTKSAFFANMSHEIRTPINTIIGLNELILREQPSEEIKEYAGNIQMASKMLLKLVSDILDLSQIEMKKMEITPEEYQFCDLIEELVGMIQIRINEKNLKFHVDISPNIPSVLYGDKKRITQVLLNILTNAVKYTDEGSVTLEIYPEILEKDRIVLKITIADTGIGIRKEDLKHLYESFYRVDQQKNARIEGSGLGLSITKQLIDLMGGNISVDSIYTKGTTFMVELEQRIVKEQPIGKIDFLRYHEKENQYEYQRLFEAPEARILVVDDNSLNVMVIEKMLQDTKVQIDVAGSGGQCLDMTMKKYYHIILMDYLMMDMNGGEVLLALRNQENGLCRNSNVILCSANSAAESKRICEHYCFDDYLEKPIDGHALEVKLLHYLPEDIVENVMKVDSLEEGEHLHSEITGFNKKRKKKICITSDSVCDLSDKLAEKNHIRIMCLYIRTTQGRFLDTREIDTSNMTKYLSQLEENATADSASVEEYETFFAEVLTSAEYIIHISMAKNSGKSYGVACSAAQGFDHVQVIDSGQVSCGEGLLVLYAAKLADEGYSVEEICREIENVKKKIFCKYLMPEVDSFFNSGRVSARIAKFIKFFHLHSVLGMRQSRLSVLNIEVGNLEKSRKHFVKVSFRKKKKINNDILIISHIACSEKEIENLKKEIYKKIPFKKIFVLNASVSSACNSSPGCIGVAYYQVK